MLETVVAKFITKYLCEYIETINKNQMEMKLWEGHATFENLILLPTALSYHNFPFKIKKGIIKRVHINFPWKKLDTEACIIEIEDVYILAQPDPDVLIKNDIEAQQSAIHISLTDTDNEKGNQEISKEFEIGTWQSLINTVIDNARILIKNIHLRVEHTYLQSVPQQPMTSELPTASPSTSSLNSYANESEKNKNTNNNNFNENNKANDESSEYDDTDETKFVSGGLIIPELTLFTVDDDNKPLLKIVQASEKLRKQFKLNNLSVYFDTHDKKVPKQKIKKKHENINDGDIPIDSESDSESESEEYFTKPVDISNFEKEMKSLMNDNNHQFILNPFYIEGILLHTRNIPDMLKNMIEITTHQLKFSMDYDQEQIFLHFNREWNRFSKRRRYASCARPKGTINSKEKVFEFWQYFTRCAIQRSRPNEFNPKLALVILKNRLKYLKLIRKYETQSNIMHPLLDSQLKTLDKKVGSSAALFCRAYSKAVVTKELNVKNSGITAFDLSELKSLLKTTDRFFDIDSFSAKLNIPSFQVEFLYDKDDPFLVAEFRKINLTINSVKGGADVHFSIDDFNVISYVNDVQKSIVYVEFDDTQNDNEKINQNYFFKVDFIIPSTTDPFQMNVYLEPTVTIIDSITIDRVFTFFEEKDNEIKKFESNLSLNLYENDDKNIKINRFDAADMFQNLLYFKNHVLNVKFKKLKYIFPFEYQRKQTSINFALKDFTINKSAIGLLAQDKPEVKMDFRVHFIIDDLMIDDCCILKEFQFDFPFFFKFFTRIDQVCLDCNFVFGKINFKTGEKELKLIIAAINYGKMIKLTENQKKQLMDKTLDKKEISSFVSSTQENEISNNQITPKSKTIISFGKVTVNLSFNFEEIKFISEHTNTTICVQSINFTYKINKGESDGLCKFGKIQLIENNEDLLKLPDNSVKIVAYQKDETEKLKISFVIDNLQLLMELRRYKQIYLKATKIINNFIKEVNFESFLIDYNKTCQKMTSSENSIKLENSKSSINIFFSKQSSKFNLELEKGKSKHSLIKHHNEEEEKERNLFDRNEKSLISFFEDANEVKEEEEDNEQEEENKKDDDDESLFEIEFQINNFEILYPDKKGRFLISISKLIISDHIEMVDFGCFRENRILIKPMPIVLHFDQLKNMKLGHLDSQFEPSDLYVITRLFYDIRYFFADSTEEEEEEETEEEEEKENDKKNRVTVTFASSRFDFYHYNTHILIVRTEEVIIDVKLNKNEIITTITINKAKAKQFIFLDDNLESPKLYKLVDFEDPIVYKYHSKGEDSSFQLTFPDTTVYFTKHDYKFIFRWIPEYDDLSPSKRNQGNSKSHYRIKCASGKVVMMQGIEQVGTLVFNDLCIDLTWHKTSNVLFELQFSEINGYTNLLQNNFHFISLPHGFYLRFHENSLLIKGKQVTVSFNIPLLLKVTNTLIEILSNIEKRSNSGISINIKIEVDETKAKFYPLEMIGPLTYAYVNKIKFALKAQQKLIAMSIDSFLIDVANANPDRALSISNMKGVLSMNETISFSEKMKQMNLEILDVDKICDLEDCPTPQNFILNKIEGVMNAKNITINYTHRSAAATILGCIPKGNEMKTLTAEKLQSLEPDEMIFESIKKQQKEFMEKYGFKPIKIKELEQDQNQLELSKNEDQNVEIILTVSVDSFYFILYLIDPLATIEFLDLTANIKDKKWNATMGEFHLYKGSDHSSNLIKSQKDSKLLNIKRNDDLYSVIFDEMEINIDLAFYLSVTNFILRSPFLHISDLQNHKEEIKSNSMVSLPFNLKIKAPKLRITIPTAIGENSKIWPLFHIDMNCKIHLVETTIELNVSDFSVSFSNQVTHDHYVPLFDHVTIKLIKKSSIINDLVSYYEEEENIELEKDEMGSTFETEDENNENESVYSTSLTFYLSEIELKLSVIDLILFENMITNISKATDSIIFAEDNIVIKNKKHLNDEIKSNSITSVTFQTEKFRVIICKDNKSSSKYIPLFNLVIPPISFKLSNTEENGSKMKLCISPYVEYFNESTGLWDMIIEPFNLKVRGEFLNNEFKVSFKIDSDTNLNINLPLIALTQFLDLFDMKKSQLLDFGEYSEFPNFWIENNLGKTFGFKIGNDEKQKSANFFNLGHQQQIPVYQLDQSSEIHINVENKTYNCVPKLLTYPTFLSCDIVAVRKPYHGGINIIIKSSTEIYNDLDFDICVYSKNSGKSSDKSYTNLGIAQSKKRFPILLPTTMNDSSNKYVDFLFMKKDLNENSKFKHQIVSLSKRYPRGLSYPILITNFLIGLDDTNGINVNMSVQNEVSTGTRLYKIYTPYVMVSNIPLSTIKIKIDGYKYTLSNNGIPQDLYLSERSTSVNIKVSLYGEKYGQITRIKIAPNTKTQCVATDDPNIFIAVAFDTTSIGSDSNKLTKVVFFSPCIIYNNTGEYLTVYEYDPQNIESNLSINIPISKYGLYTPKSFIRYQKMTKYIHLKVNNSRDTKHPIDVQTPRTANAFINLNSANNNDEEHQKLMNHIKFGFRYDVSIKKLITVVTFSPLIKVKNELKDEITLQALHSKHKKLKGDLITIPPFRNDSIENESNEKSIIKMTTSGVFALSIPSVSVLIREVCLIKEQKICFRFYYDDQKVNQKFYMVELVVTDVGTHYEAVFKDATFPTPVLIENCLPVEVKAFQLDESRPFEIDPDSTSVFGFDNPLDCSSLYFLFKDGQRLNISTVEETRVVETYVTIPNKLQRTNSSQVTRASSASKKSARVPVFVEVKLLINGSMAVVLSYKRINKRKTLIKLSSSSLLTSSSIIDTTQSMPQIEFVEESSKSSDNKSDSESEQRISLSSLNSSNQSFSTFPLTNTAQIAIDIHSIHISLIDLETREVALITIDGVKTNFERKNNTYRFFGSIKGIQIDDQDTSAPYPVCLIGHSKIHSSTSKTNETDNEVEIEKEEEIPFFRIECAIPADVPFMSRFSYLSANFQRVDALLDSAFLSDFIYILMNFLKPVSTGIGPQQPKNVANANKDIFQSRLERIKHNETKEEEEDKTKEKKKQVLSSNIQNKTLSININWLQMSPIYVVFGYNRKSGRKKQFNEMFSSLNYIPSLSPDELILPGIIMERIIGEPNSILEKVSSEYKTASFNQIISMLGSTGSLLQTFGITNLIAGILGVKIESDLIRYPSTTEFDNFLSSPPDSKSQFDNRRESSGPFSNDSLYQLKSIIKSSNFKHSHIINALIHNNNKNLNKKNDNENAQQKHHNIDYFEMYIDKAMPNGVFGILKGNGVDKKKIFIVKEPMKMSESTRKRVPRAFLNNKIEVFDEKYAIAQKTIGKGRIRMAGHLAPSDNTFKNKKRLLVVLTDTSIYILSADMKSVLIKINFASLEKLDVTDNLVYISTPEKIVISKDKHFKMVDNQPECMIECDSEEMADRMYVFIQSQRLMFLSYGVSLIE